MLLLLLLLRLVKWRSLNNESPRRQRARDAGWCRQMDLSVAYRLQYTSHNPSRPRELPHEHSQPERPLAHTRQTELGEGGPHGTAGARALCSANCFVSGSTAAPRRRSSWRVEKAVVTEAGWKRRGRGKDGAPGHALASHLEVGFQHNSTGVSIWSLQFNRGLKRVLRIHRRGRTLVDAQRVHGEPRGYQRHPHLQPRGSSSMQLSGRKPTRTTGTPAPVS